MTIDDGSLLFEAVKHPNPQQAFEAGSWRMFFLMLDFFDEILLNFVSLFSPKYREKHGKVLKTHEMSLIVLGSPPF